MYLCGVCVHVCVMGSMYRSEESFVGCLSFPTFTWVPRIKLGFPGLLTSTSPMSHLFAQTFFIVTEILSL